MFASQVDSNVVPEYEINKTCIGTKDYNQLKEKPLDWICAKFLAGEIVDVDVSGTKVTVDVAIAEILPCREVTCKDIVPVSEHWLNYGGSAVSKIGRTTGLTHGYVTYGPSGAKITDKATGKERIYENQLTIIPTSEHAEKFCDGGDSGSLVFLTELENPIVLGLLHGETPSMPYNAVHISPIAAVLAWVQKNVK